MRRTVAGTSALSASLAVGMAPEAKLIRLRVVTPEAVVLDGTAKSIVAPAWDGWLGVLPGHAPLLTLLGEGPLTVESESGDRTRHQIAGGVMKVESNEVTVLADRIG